MPATTPTPQAIAERGDAIYERDILPTMRAEDHNQIVAIDIHSGAYAIDSTAYAASNRLRERYPDAEVWLVRVGHRTLHHIRSRSIGAGVVFRS